ncbi:hypothetical protein CAPTEDRAFT_200198 [Capitella teleta]|uniref:Hcy-binding domain-containing protein n=1 Tax=Capitella teleta TaxID=283909 RepID=R7V4R9_CAPTE|nr:hypothetical protein CAPTEDRAFT_200198 [Capitella teleta]|eukprot:ELU10765.1 hypothetical protein CAPTEDRAFT_200198 [Capitella teleta]
MTTKVKGLVERLKDGEDIIVAEGYLFEFERRGYLRAGCFVPEVVLEHPELVKVMHEEFVHAGSDVVEAFTYYAHREKLKVIGRENDLEILNRKALKIAREVANETNTLMAGNISNTTIYEPGNKESEEKVREIFKEQVEWAVEEGADYIIGETYQDGGEAMLALECIKKYGKGTPAVITISPTNDGISYDGVPLEQVARKLEDAGAACVGINCYRGPDTMRPLIQKVRAACKGPIACLPSLYRTNDQVKSMVDFKDHVTGESAYPADMDPYLISRRRVTEFTKELKELGVQYFGLCCGNKAYFTRAMAEALGRKPPASRYSPDMSQHFTNFKDGEHERATRNFYVKT